MEYCTSDGNVIIRIVRLESWWHAQMHAWPVYHVQRSQLNAILIKCESMLTYIYYSFNPKAKISLSGTRAYALGCSYR